MFTQFTMHWTGHTSINTDHKIWVPCPFLALGLNAFGMIALISAINVLFNLSWTFVFSSLQHLVPICDSRTISTFSCQYLFSWGTATWLAMSDSPKEGGP